MKPRIKMAVLNIVKEHCLDTYLCVFSLNMNKYSYWETRYCRSLTVQIDDSLYRFLLCGNRTHSIKLFTGLRAAMVITLKKVAIIGGES